MRFTKSLGFVFPFLCSYCATSAQDVAPVKDSFVVNQDTVYSTKDVDVIAEYPGGDAARIKFIEKNVNGLVPVENGAPSGAYTVVITCIIDTDGKIIAAVPATSHGYGMEKEVIRIIRKLPKPYSPALKNGLPVKSKINFPVMFSISG
jgi:protein TonB